MKKSRMNALLTAGCLTLLAPMGAQAADFGNITDSPTITEDSTFDTVTTSDGNTITIDTTAGSLTPNAGQGAATLNGTSAIEFAPAINAITFT